MKWEPRKIRATTGPASLQTDLPIDYLKVVEETIEQACLAGVEILKSHQPICKFSADGAIFGEEVMLAVTLSHGANNLAATTVYASANFNPLAPGPGGIEAVLAACLDAIGGVYDFYLDPTQPEQIELLGHTSMSALEEAPFEWTPAPKSNTHPKIPIWVKMDKTNPHLERLTDQWLRENDPLFHERTEKEEQEAQEFLEERLEAIKNAKSGSGGSGGSGLGGAGGGQNGPITH
jgi:hypothetical protein